MRFASLQEAKEAVQSCHSRLLGGRHIRVEFACETQRLLDKDGGDFSSDTESKHKLIKQKLRCLFVYIFPKKIITQALFVSIEVKAKLFKANSKSFFCFCFDILH